MIKALVTVNNRATLFLGMERVNTDAIHRNKPIVIDLQALLQGAPDTDAIQDLVIIAGETLAEVHADLAKVLPLPPFEEPVA